MTTEAILVHLGLGSNLGDRKEYLSMACYQLRSEAVREFRASSIYESEPLLKMKQSKYFNMVVCGLTVLSPKDLLKKCQQIEISLGRIRSDRLGSREIEYMFCLRMDMFFRDVSMKITFFAPRLKASIPRAPVPA